MVGFFLFLSFFYYFFVALVQFGGGCPLALLGN
jgi:hypothetical protein